jgi:hypothetical protein
MKLLALCSAALLALGRSAAAHSTSNTTGYSNDYSNSNITNNSTKHHGTEQVSAMSLMPSASN